MPIFFALIGRTRKSAFLIVFSSALIYFLESLHWLSIFGWYAWVGASLLEALYPALWGALIPPFLADDKFSFLDLIFPPLSFTAMEAIRNLGPIGFPWGDLAVSQWKFLPILQSASLFGSLFITFLILMFNTLIFYALRNKSWKPALTGILMVGLFAAFGMIRMQKPLPHSKITVSVLQTNDLQSIKWGGESLPAVLSEMDTLVQSASKEKSDFVLFPETAIPGYLNDDPKLQQLVLSWGAQLQKPMTVGTFGRLEGQPQNEIELAFPDGSRPVHYDKIKLVPFGEYLPLFFKPLRGHWRALDPIVDLKPGETFTVFTLPQARFSTMICFESMFGWIGRRFVLNGSELLTVATNDAWFFGTLAQEHHAAMSILRGIETGRSVIQAGNTGISLFSDPYGRILAWEDPNRSAVLTASVPLVDSWTLYDRIGDLFPYLCIALSAGLLVFKRKKILKENANR